MKVLARVKEAGLKLSADKCKFLKTEVNYLGHVINKEGVQTDPEKIACIEKWELPNCKKELQTFLGFCNYYRRFIKNYAAISERLTAMLKEGNDFRWNDDRRLAFTELKKKLMSPPVLALPIKEGKYILDTDASYNSIGAVLSQEQNGIERVISYASKTMSKSQRQYCITRKELLAIYTFVLKFKHYLLGTQFVVRTDHQALKWLLKWDNPNTSQYCIWRAELEVFDMIVEYRKGGEHINADALSRLPPCEQCLIMHLEPKKRRNVKVHGEKASTISEKGSQESERVLYKIQDEGDEWEQEKDETLKTILTIINEKNYDMNKTYDEILKGGKELKKIWELRKELRLRGGLIFLFRKDDYRLLIPQHKRNSIVDELHRALGHVGIEKTLQALKREYYWPNMKITVQKIIEECVECTHHKYKNGRVRAPLQSIVATEPFQILGIDITGPFEISKGGYKYILGVIDYFSKYVSLIPIRTTDAETVAKELFTHWISKFGVPGRVHSDCGSNFNSKLFSEYCKIMGIQKTFTSPYYPQSDGLVERLFRTAKSMIGAVMEERQTKDWSSVLPVVELGLRATVQKTTGYSPFELIFGRKPRLPQVCTFYGNMEITNYEYLEQLKRKVRDLRLKANTEITKRKKEEADLYNKNRWNTKAKVGDKVMIKNENCLHSKRNISGHSLF